jgi:ketosteroid isomerase-like protein
MKFPRLFILLSIILFFYLALLAAPNKAELNLTKVRMTVEGANKKFIDASLRGDAVAAAALSTDDTILLPPNSPMIQGKKATEEYWRTTWAQLKITDFKMAIVNLSGQGNLVYEVGNYTIKFQFQGKEGVEEGKYVVLWKRMTDKTWKKHVDMWNTNMPTQP